MGRGGIFALGLALLLPVHVHGQGSQLDVLEDELKEAKQLRQDTTAQAMSTFFTQVDAAMADPGAAIKLYQAAGGIMPDATPVATVHTYESASERDARQVQDAANQRELGTALQLHCGVMHFAALFVTRPDQPGLQQDWAAWLAKAGAVYPTLVAPAPASASDPSDDSGSEGTRRRRGPAAHAFNPGDIMGKPMRDSVIGKYLGFQQWGGKEPGNWAAKDIPKLYKQNVLDPLRAKPSDVTLAAWDVYIAMADADETDPDRWTQSDLPPLLFEKACDDYAIAPDTQKLEVLVNMIKANPGLPQVDDWIARTKALMDDYRAQHGGKATVAQNPATPGFTPPPATPGVSVTAQQQGDAVIITTHTNTPPAHGAPPGP